MEFLFEVIFQFLGELILQALFEVLAELGFRGLADALKRPRNPALSTLGFALWGAIAGGISLWIAPMSPIHDPALRTLNLFLTPVALGFLMMLVGGIWEKKGRERIRLDRFGYAFVFAFAMAMVRYAWAA